MARLVVAQVWVPCRVTQLRHLSLRIAVVDDTLHERTVYVPRTLLAGRREGALLLPRWWVDTHPGLPFDVS